MPAASEQRLQAASRPLIVDDDGELDDLDPPPRRRVAWVGFLAIVALGGGALLARSRLADRSAVVERSEPSAPVAPGPAMARVEPLGAAPAGAAAAPAATPVPDRGDRGDSKLLQATALSPREDGDERSADPKLARARAAEAAPLLAACHAAFSEGRMKDAEAACVAARDANPESAEAAGLLAHALYNRGHRREALGAAERAVKINPKWADAYVIIGGVHQDAGELDDAKRAYDRYLELEPKGQYARDLRSIVGKFEPSSSSRPSCERRRDLGKAELNMLVLGIETSCDETGAAIVEDGRRVRADIVASQIRVHAPYGGVVPEVASRQHVATIVPVVREAMKAASIGFGDLDGLAVTGGPGLVGALLVGVETAKALAYAIGRPLVGVNHLAGHLAAAFLEEPALPGPPPYPHLALLVSGGHTALIRVDGPGQDAASRLHARRRRRARPSTRSASCWGSDIRAAWPSTSAPPPAIRRPLRCRARWPARTIWTSASRGSRRPCRRCWPNAAPGARRRSRGRR